MIQESTSLGAIAEKTGFSKSTVSRALNGHPAISADTRNKVMAEVQRVGYRPNIYVNAVMRRIRASSNATTRDVIAYIYRTHPSHPLQSKNFAERMVNALDKTASSKGFSIDAFNFNDYEATPHRLDRVLRARGIRGVILGSGLSANDRPELNWENLTCIVLGNHCCHLPLNRVGMHHEHDVCLTYQQLRNLGYGKIGFVADEVLLANTDQSMVSGFLLGHYRFGGKRVPTLVVSSWEQESIGKWYRRHKPDAIIAQGSGPRMQKLLELNGLSVPDDVALGSLNCVPGDSRFAGIVQRPDVIGQLLVESLCLSLGSFQRGMVPYPQLHLVEGTWNPGQSAPNRLVKNETEALKAK